MLHVMFNMMALVPMGSELERIMGSVRLFYLTILLATTNAVLHLLIASLAGYNPFYQYDHLMNECAIGFSGILFSMIVIETSLSGVTSRRLRLFYSYFNNNFGTSFVFMRHLIYLYLLLSFSLQCVWSLQRAS